MSFHVGQKVVCVRGDGEWTGPPSGMRDTIFPQKDEVYTIREVFVGPLHYSDRTYVRLSEIRNDLRPTVLGPFEAGFVATAFRPIVERKADISVFTAMLTPKKQPVDA